MASPLILVVEDDASLQKVLSGHLRRNGFEVLLAGGGREGLSLARSHNPDLVLLDLGLPDLDGLEVLQDLRNWGDAPVVILSARTQERQKVEALDLGADDYLTKPFGAQELLARLRVALRHGRRELQQEASFVLGDLRVDLERREVSLHGQAVKLTPLEYRLLEALVGRAGRVATHQQLLTEVWGPGNEGQNHYLRIYMANLRRKLEADPTRPGFLLTEPGIGYRLRVD